MKLALTSLFSCLVLFCYSQNITKDTTLANQYITKVKTENLTDSLQNELLSKAIAVYEKHQVTRKLIESKSLFAFKNFINAPDLTAEIFQLADAAYQTDNHPSLIYAYLALQYHHTLNNTEKALKYGKKTMKIAPKLSEEYFMAGFALIEDYAYDYRLDEAQNLLDELEQSIKETPSLASSALNVNINKTHLIIKSKQGNFESAATYGKKCISENEQHQVIKKELGTIYVEVGKCYAYLGRLEEAIDWMEQGLEKANLSADDPKTALYFENMSFAYHLNRDLKNAIQFNEKAIGMMAKHKEANKGSLMTALVNNSVYYYQLGDVDNALKAIEQSYEYGENYGQYIHHANLLSRKEKYLDALAKVQKGIIDLSTNFNKEDINENPNKSEQYSNAFWAGNALISKTGILYKYGLEKQSAELFQQAVATSKLAVHVETNALTELKGFEMAKMSYSQGMYIALQFQAQANQELYALTKVNQYLQDYFRATEQLKAMNLLEILTPSSLPSAVLAQEEELLQSLRLLQQKTETTTTDSLTFFQNQLFEVTQTYETFLSQLRQDFPKETVAFYNMDYADIPSVQAQLKETDLYLDYGCTNKYLNILSITKESTELTRVDINQEFIDEIASMQQLLKDPLLMQRSKRASFVKTSHQLYQKLIAPIAQQLKGKTTIIISPEKELFYLPFEVLLSTDELEDFSELEFLLKKHQISYQYSATIYRQLQNLPAIKDNSLLAFAPIFEKQDGAGLAASNRASLPDSLLRSIDGGSFVHLPNSKKEVNTISKILSEKGKTEVLLEQKASKANLMNALTAQPYQFLHIATHGIVNFQNPTLSALACYKNQESAENLFYANEIQLQDLKADLVVLSSCESGIGQLIKGEGLLALSRSFIYAGARNVLFSLWKVNDRHTSTLMIDFYKSYAAGASYAEALRKAKLRLLENPVTANPNYWASFVLIGK